MMRRRRRMQQRAERRRARVSLALNAACLLVLVAFVTASMLVVYDMLAIYLQMIKSPLIPVYIALKMLFLAWYLLVWLVLTACGHRSSSSSSSSSSPSSSRCASSSSTSCLRFRLAHHFKVAYWHQLNRSISATTPAMSVASQPPPPPPTISLVTANTTTTTTSGVTSETISRRSGATSTVSTAGRRRHFTNLDTYDDDDYNYDDDDDDDDDEAHYDYDGSNLDDNDEEDDDVDAASDEYMRLPTRQTKCTTHQQQQQQQHRVPLIRHSISSPSVAHLLAMASTAATSRPLANSREQQALAIIAESKQQQPQKQVPRGSAGPPNYDLLPQNEADADQEAITHNKSDRKGAGAGGGNVTNTDLMARIEVGGASALLLASSSSSKDRRGGAPPPPPGVDNSTTDAAGGDLTLNDQDDHDDDNNNATTEDYDLICTTNAQPAATANDGEVNACNRHSTTSSSKKKPAGTFTSKCTTMSSGTQLLRFDQRLVSTNSLAANTGPRLDVGACHQRQQPTQQQQLSNGVKKVMMPTGDEHQASPELAGGVYQLSKLNGRASSSSSSSSAAALRPKSHMVVSNHAANDITNMNARSNRVNLEC